MSFDTRALGSLLRSIGQALEEAERADEAAERRAREICQQERKRTLGMEAELRRRAESLKALRLEAMCARDSAHRQAIIASIIAAGQAPLERPEPPIIDVVAEGAEQDAKGTEGAAILLAKDL